MKLCIVTSRYPNQENPYRHMFVHVRALYFQSQNVELKVFVPSKTKNEYVYQSVEVSEMPTSQIVNQLDSYDLRYLHLLNFYPKADGGWAIYRAIKSKKLKTAVYLHGTEVLQYPNFMFDFKYTPRGILKYLYVNYWQGHFMKDFLVDLEKAHESCLLTPSQWMKNQTEEVYNYTFKNFHIVPNGIDTDLFQYVGDFKNRKKIICIRSFDDRKYAVDQAIKIMQYLPEDYTLDIYGKGFLQYEYEKLIEELDLSHRVVIKNQFIHRKDINAHLSSYGIFFAFSLTDAQGVMMCEAMASGLLTVSNDCTAIPEFVKHLETGVVTNDLKETAKNILEITNNPRLFREITVRGRESMIRINWRITGEKELNILKNLIKEDEN